MELHVINESNRQIVVLLDDEMQVIKPVYDFLRFQRQRGRALNTLKANGRDLQIFWRFLTEQCYQYDNITPLMIADFIDYLRGNNSAVLALYKESARTNQTINRILSTVFVTKELRNEADENIKDYLFIYRCKSGRFVGQIKQVNYENFALFYLPGFVKRHNIIDSDGNLYKLTCHQFRRTLGTDMLSKGTDINVIQQVLGHAEPATTKRFYADVKDKERAETFKSIGIVGNINLLDMSFFENEEELNWFHKHKDTSACLCDGYCTKPVVNGQVCDRLLRRQKCYTCSRYITTPEYLEAHKNHLAGLERQIAEGAIYGQHYAEHFLPTIEVLRSIIERLEEIKSARD